MAVTVFTALSCVGIEHVRQGSDLLIQRLRDQQIRCFGQAAVLSDSASTKQPMIVTIIALWVGLSFG